MIEPARKRYDTLDGMRGVAAVAVVYMHAFGLTSPNGSDHSNLRFGYLAVDMFFVLSGFVIAHSYDRRFAAGMTAWEFLKRRIIRLYPLYLIGAVLGSAEFIHDLKPPLKVTIETLGLGAFCLPSPTRAFIGSMIPVLSPGWSLFEEFYVANVGFALLWRRLSALTLAALMLVSAAGLVWAVRKYGNISGGPLWAGSPVGVIRVVFSFSFGVLIQRWHHRWKPPAVPAWVILLLTVLTFTPRLNGAAANVYELACVALIYPALVYLGAHSRAKNQRLSAALGDTSYAVYLIHIPLLLELEGHLYRLHLKQSPGLAAVFVVAVCILAYALQRYCDTPLRAWLSARLLRANPHRKATAPPPPA